MAEAVLNLSGTLARARRIKVSVQHTDYAVDCSGLGASVADLESDYSTTGVRLSGSGARVFNGDFGGTQYGVEFAAAGCQSIGNKLYGSTSIYHSQTGSTDTGRALDTIHSSATLMTVTAGTEPRVGLDALNNTGIDTAGKTDGHIVYWDAATNRYKLKAAAAAGASALDDLSDVDTTGKSTSDLLQWDGASWVDVPVPDLDDLPNVDTTGKADGYILAWDTGSSKWVDSVASSATLAGLTDTDVGTKSDGDHLYWDSAAGDWKAEAPPSTGVAAVGTKVELTSTQTIATAGTIPNFDAVLGTDDGSFWSAGNPERLTAAASGWHLIESTWRLTSAPSCDLWMEFAVNGSGLSMHSHRFDVAGSNYRPGLNASVLLYLTASDYVTVKWGQDSGGNLTADTKSWLTMVQL